MNIDVSFTRNYTSSSSSTQEASLLSVDELRKLDGDKNFTVLVSALERQCAVDNLSFSINRIIKKGKRD